MPTPVRLVALVLLVGYVAGLTVVLMQYDPTVASRVVTAVESWLGRAGAPALVTVAGRVEFVLNALMVVPVVLLAALLLPGRPWAGWVAYAFVLSCVVELAQGLLLPPRSAQAVDVVANTLGALGGVLAARLVLSGATRSSGMRRD